MTSFAYTTGNPNNLTAGANASMNDIQGPFTDLRTFLNGANLSDPNYQNAGMSLSKLTPLILYGLFNGSDGSTVTAGSGGWTASRSGAGLYTVTFTVAYSSAPIVLSSPNTGASVSTNINSVSTSNASIHSHLTSTGAAQDANIMFLVIGAR